MANQYLFIIPALLLLFTLTDSPKYYISKGNYESAKSVIHKIYKTDGNTGQAARITRFIGNTGD